MNYIDDLNFNPENEQEYKDELEKYIQVRISNSVFNYKKEDLFKRILTLMIYYKHYYILLLLKINKYTNFTSLEFKQDIHKITESSYLSCTLCNLDRYIQMIKLGYHKQKHN